MPSRPTAWNFVSNEAPTSAVATIRLVHAMVGRGFLANRDVRHAAPRPTVAEADRRGRTAQADSQVVPAAQAISHLRFPVSRSTSRGPVHRLLSSPSSLLSLLPSQSD